MISTEFEHLLGRIHGLVISLAEVLSPEESSEVSELLDHAELGEALRTLAWLIVEEDKRVEVTGIREIETIAAQMGIVGELPATLIEHGVAEE